MLTDKAGDYVEIQAGLGKTQYECIPMPPKCVWSFSECYTLADISADAVCSDYADLVNAVQSQIHSLGGCALLDFREGDKFLDKLYGVSEKRFILKPMMRLLFPNSLILS